MFRLRGALCICLFVIVTGLPLNGYAQTISAVGGANITKGSVQAEFRAGFQVDDESDSQDQRLRTRQHINIGTTDHHALRFVVFQDNRQGDNHEHEALRLENHFQFLDKANHGLDLGLRINYTHADGDKTPHDIDARIVAEIPLNNDWELRFNSIVAHDIGPNSNSGLQYEWRTQVTKGLENGLRIGVDMFNDFGNLREVSGYSEQDHIIGPVVKGRFGQYSFEAGFRSGISRGALDQQGRFFLTRSF